MKQLIEVLKTIFKIEDLRNKIFITLGFILVYRFGAHVVLPGLDPMQLSALQKQASTGIMSLLNMFSGGAFGKASIFALGIMPYISASIVMQLLAIAIPYFQKLQMEGESGRKKITQMTRYLTILILLVQAPAYLANLHYQLPSTAFLVQGWKFDIPSVILLTAGTIFVMWLGERITDKGVGNGISLLIMIGIIARLPAAISYEFGARLEPAGGGLIAFLVELIILFFVFIAAIALVQAVRKVPVQYAKRIIGNKQYMGARQYIPLKVNAAGVMPIIFAQALMFFPALFINSKSEFLRNFAITFSDITGFWYNFVYFLLIIAFTYFYTAITINPHQMAEEIRRNNGLIPGVKPGKPTEEYLDSILSKVTLPGSIFLGIIAILPAFAIMAGVNTKFAYFYGGTSLLILVGVILDTLQQIESHLLMRNYDGFMKGSRLKGRSFSTI